MWEEICDFGILNLANCTEDDVLHSNHLPANYKISFFFVAVYISTTFSYSIVSSGTSWLFP
jgi:hypothetical protein